MLTHSYILQKGIDCQTRSGGWGGAGWSAVFSATDSVSQGSRTGAAVEGSGAWVVAGAAAEPKMKWSTVQ